jgi:hypothetical protein
MCRLLNLLVFCRYDATPVAGIQPRSYYVSTGIPDSREGTIGEQPAGSVNED